MAAAETISTGASHEGLIERLGERAVELIERDATLRKYTHAGLIELARQYRAEARRVLGVSRWVCSACGAIHDRDHNAAKNIYAYGEERRNVTGNTVESAWTGGDQAGAIPPVPQDETRTLKRAARESNRALV